MAASLRAKGDSLREIADKMKVSKTTVTRMLDDYDLSDHNSEEEGRKPQ
jgi:transposase